MYEVYTIEVEMGALQTSTKIAVVGVGSILPGASNALQFWREIIKGKDLITEVPSDHWDINDFYDKDPHAKDKTYCRRGGFIPHIEFDPIEWGIPPQNLIATDTSQLLGLIVAKEVLKDTYDGKFMGVDLSRASVILGTTCLLEMFATMSNRQTRPLWEKAMRDCGLPENQLEMICDRISDFLPPWKESTFPGLLMNVVAGRIANRLNFGGTNCTTDAACASSLAAFSMGINELILHQSDLAVVGGVDTLNDPTTFMCFSKTPALSITEDCRPFSSKADGTILGEGICFLALKRLEDAEEQGNHIYAVIRGIGSSSDGRSKSIYAPVAKGQEFALQRAYEMAGYSPSTVELVEGHGTGTKAGDAEEFKSLKEVYELSDPHKKQWCALGSVKSQIGHTKGAAGAASVFKAVMALHHKVLPPTLKVEQPNPALDINNSPFYLNTQARPWIKRDALPRRASVSSFGFGGTNFHVTIEEYLGSGKKALRTSSVDHQLILISGNDPSTVLHHAEELKRDSQHYDARFVAQCARDSHKKFAFKDNYRVAIIADTNDELNKKLGQLIQHLEKNPEIKLTIKDLYYSGNSAESKGKLAFLFSGHGSQYLQMGADLAMEFDSSRRVWEDACNISLDKEHTLVDVVFPKPAFTEQEQKDNERLINETIWSEPSLAAMEYAQISVLENLEIKSDLVAGHHCGELAALSYAGAYHFETLIQIARKRAEVMTKNDNKDKAVHEFKEYLQALQLNELTLPVFSCQHAEPYPIDAQSIKNALAEAINPPVHFHDTVLQMYEAGVRTFVEIGPHDVLTKLVNAILGDKPFDAIALDNQHEHGVISLLRALGQMAAAGVFFNLEQLMKPFVASEEAETLASKHHKILINGANIKPEVAPLKTIITEPTQLKESQVEEPVQSVTAVVEVKKMNRENNQKTEKDEQLDSTLLNVIQQMQASIVKQYEIYQINAAESQKTFMELMRKSLDKLQPSSNEIRMPIQVSRTEEQTEQMFNEPLSVKPAQIKQIAVTTEKKQPVVKPEHALNDIVLDIVSQETGYPVDMLNMQMDIEADLGIDSIKRVEILSALKEKIPNLPPLDPTQLATLKTLAQLRDHLQNNASAPVQHSLSQEKAEVEPTTQDYSAVILEVIANETGYPIEMINLDMDMEADLGIDSIKRVEILAGIKDKLPDLPSLDPTQLSVLQTLRQLSDYFNGQTLAHPAAPIETPQVPVEAATQTGGGRIEQTLKPCTLPNHALPGLSAHPVYIIKDKQGISGKIAESLHIKGISIEEIENAAQIAAINPCIIYLAGLDVLTTKEEAIAINQASFNFLKSIAKSVEKGGTVVLVQDNGGLLGCGASDELHAWSSGLISLARTARLEWPNTFVKFIDIDCTEQTPDQIAEHLTTELMRGGNDNEVGIGLHQERVIVEDKQSLYESSQKLDLVDGDVILVSGGARGITSWCIRALATRYHLNFILLGRTALREEPEYYHIANTDAELKQAIFSRHRIQNDSIPTPQQVQSEVNTILANREIQQTLDALKAKGSQASYHVVDIQDKQQLETLVNQVITQYGAIKGLIHGAGVLHDKFIAQKSEEEFKAVFHTKVNGLKALLETTSTQPLKLMCMFSSVVARYGNKGQCDYAMANQVLNAIAQYEAKKRGAQCLVKSINWGAWAGGMVTPELYKQFQARGVSLFTREQGTQLFIHELVHSHPVVVVLGEALNPETKINKITHEFVITQDNDPYLYSHSIKGKPVVPVCLALEWFATVAKMINPNLKKSTFVNLKVLRGIRLDDLKGQKFFITSNQSAEMETTETQMSLKDESGNLCYSIGVQFESRATKHHPMIIEPQGAWPWTIADCYGDPSKLFHGPEFYVIKSLDGYDENSVSATLSGLHQLNWPDRDWTTDPGVVDGAFQVASLFAQRLFHRGSIPMKISRITLYHHGIIKKPIKCFVQYISHNDYSAHYNIYLMMDGKLIMEINDLEMVAVPQTVDLK